MKRTNKSWVYFTLQLIFMLVVPCIIVWLQYGKLVAQYKISVTAILLLMLIFCVFKKIVLHKWIKTLDNKIANIETNALTITDKNAIESNKKAWRNYSIFSLLFSIVLPLLVFILAIITIKTVEQGLIKLYGCLIFCLISVGLGILFRMLEIYSMKLSHE